jgi:hypothetical protein
MPATNKNLAPSGQEGSRTFYTAMWNIVNGWGGEIKAGGCGIGVNGDRGGGIDGDKIC